MKIVDRNTIPQNMSDTNTMQHFGTLLGDKPHKLGTVVTMYPQLAISTLTDALKNVYYNPKKSEGSFSPINSMCIEWKIDVNFIKEVKIVGDISGDGAGEQVVSILLGERYYDKNDTFTLENKQQLFVVAVPKKLSQERWEYKVRLVSNDPTKSIDTRFAASGFSTRYRSNYFPELSERGYTKFVSNTEKHRNYISRHRASVDKSSDFARSEEVYIKAAKGKDGDAYFKMQKAEKKCLDHFLFSRDNSCMWSETNYDVNGKCRIQDNHNRDVPMGDGVVAQIERYCDKFSFSILTTDVLDDVIASMVAKSDNPTGNTYAVICNELLWAKFGKLMKDDLRFVAPNDGSYFYSKDKGREVNVGASFKSYHVQGNTITFMPDRSLSQEYPNHAYGIFLDTGVDLNTGRPNLAMFTVKGSEMITGTLNGMGGQDGMTSGEVSTGVAGSEYHLMGYAGTVVFNPYKSFILEESVVL
jgi:hypothetical protein